MLAPDSRALLLDALRPPPGHSLDRAVATTYTLDLETALMVPLAFAGFRFDEEQDPVEVMEALRAAPWAERDLQLVRGEGHAQERVLPRDGHVPR